jgi:UDP-glucose 4-epimerase
MKWLITGAAGYIGQHIVEHFQKRNLDVLALDIHDFSDASPLKDSVEFVRCDISDKYALNQVFLKYSIEGIVNLAALKSVEESMLHPEKYNLVNYQGVKNLIECAIEFKVDKFIQSSTAAVYGSSSNGLVSEGTPTFPISPYGNSKLNAERELVSAIRQSLLRGVCFRYFNVMGSVRNEFKDKSGSNLLPLVLNSIRRGEAPKIFGTDYSTPDGTAVRDYIHVVDLAEAHYSAAVRLGIEDIPEVLNLGSGIGYSVSEVISELLKQTGSSLRPETFPRRLGDVEKIVADIKLAEKTLGFSPRFNLSQMIESSI